MRLQVAIRIFGEAFRHRARALFSWPPDNVRGSKAVLLFMINSKIVKVRGHGNKVGGWGPVSGRDDEVGIEIVEFEFFIRRMEKGTYELSAYSKDGGQYYDDEELDTLEMVFARALELYEIDPEEWKTAT